MIIPTRRAYEAALDALEPAMRLAFLSAVQKITERAAIRRLENAIRDGRIEDAIRLAGLREGAWTSVTESVRNAFMEGGNVIANAAPVGLGFVFNPTNPAAESWLRANSSNLITRINNEQREVIRFMLTEGIHAGQGPRQTALDIVGRINRQTGRRAGGVVGLTKPQAVYVRNAWKDLVSGDRTRMAGYFQRTLRDRRFDGIVERAMKQGVPVAMADADRIVNRYADRLLKHRGEVIARTETLQAVNAGKDQAIQQAVKDGYIKNADNLTRVWRTASDSRVRDIHQSMNGQRRGSQGGNRAPFTSGNGEQLNFPGDQSLGASAVNIIQCRCMVQHEVDWISEAELDSGATTTVIPPRPITPTPPPTPPPTPRPSPVRRDLTAFESGAGAAVDRLWSSSNKITILSNLLDARPARVTVNNTTQSYYQPGNNFLFSKRSSSTFTHEYGHFIDYNLNEKIGSGGRAEGYSHHKGLSRALRKDAKNSGLLGERFNEIADNFKQSHYRSEVKTTRFAMTTRLTPENEWTGKLSDIYDAATKGGFHAKGMHGHGARYFKQGKMISTEAFANMVALRDRPEWEEIKRMFPTAAKLFDEMIETATKELES